MPVSPPGRPPIGRIKAVLDRKRGSLDAFIAEFVSARSIVEDFWTDPVAIDEIKQNALAAAEALVNPAVIEVIFSDDPLLHHDLSTHKKYQSLLTTHNKMEKALRDLILFAYEGDIGKEDVRRKIIGCTNIILDRVNDRDFYDSLNIGSGGGRAPRLKKRH